MRMIKMARVVSFVAVIVAALLQLGFAGEAAAEKKAFIVGNSKYAHVTGLANPANDAQDLATRLKALGYQVTIVFDVERQQFLSRFQTFAQGLRSDDLALFFFAGHALQIGGENYLFPIDAKVDREADARQRLVPLNALLADLSRNTRSRIVILDACRNNPFVDEIAKAQQTRSAGAAPGLARVYAGVGSFIAYSTQPGNVALDGDGRNSPFTAALLRHIAAPGADVHAVMRRVRGDVQRETREQQIPWENSSLVDEVAFAVAGPTGAAAPKPVAKPAVVMDSFHYVTGLDPKGDNFLALRAGTSGDAARIATLGPNTLLKVTETSGDWKKVVLSDGVTGWAHGKWIACCRSAARVATPSNPMPATPAAETCESSWTRRNAIWHRHGYCFTSDKGKQVFGNAGCSRDEKAARAAMSPGDRDLVEALGAQERAMGCR